MGKQNMPKKSESQKVRERCKHVRRRLKLVALLEKLTDSIDDEEAERTEFRSSMRNCARFIRKLLNPEAGPQGHTIGGRYWTCASVGRDTEHNDLGLFHLFFLNV